MNRRYSRKRRKTSKIKETLLIHIENNLREYVIVTIIFLVGIIIGVIFINNISVEQKTEINNYISEFISNLKENSNVNEFALLKDSISKNCVLAIFLWFMGSTVIGISIVYLIICFRGFCLGYTISAIILTCGTGKGILFLASTILLQNILFIPCVLALAVSGMRLHNSIIKDGRRQNIKLEILKHTVFSMILLILLILSSVIEVYVSKNIFHCILVI